MLSAPPGRRDADAASGDELAAVLRACADRVSGSRERLKAFYGESLTGRLGRTLAERALNEPSLQAALDDAWAEAGSFDPSRESAEEWLFGRVRQARGIGQRAPAGRSAPSRQPPPPPEPKAPPPMAAAPREPEPPPAPAPARSPRAEAASPPGGFWPPSRQPQPQPARPAAVTPPPRPVPAPVPPPVMREPPPPPPPREEPRRVVEPPPPVAEVRPEPPPRPRIEEEAPLPPPERSPRSAGLREAAAPSFDPAPAERSAPEAEPRMSARITAVRPGRDRPVIYYDPERERAKAGSGSWRVFLVLVVLAALGAAAAVLGPRLMGGDGLPAVVARASAWLPRDWLPAAMRPGPVQEAPLDLGAPLSAPEPARPASPSPVRPETAPAQGAPASGAGTPPRAVAPATTPRPANRSDALEPAGGQSGGRVRVFLHYSAIDGGEVGEAQRLAGQLERQGFEVAELRPVPFRIGTGGVRYFFRDDRREASRLRVACARLLGPEASRLGSGQPSDYTRYEPKPAPGTVEVWLPSAAS